jgi:hypothetical protein
MSSKWYEEHREEIKEKRKLYREQNKEKIRAQRKAEYEKHKEAYLQRAKKRAEKHKTEIREYQRAWDRDKYAESLKIYNTSMYKFESDVTILSGTNVRYKGISYHIHRHGYFSGGTNKQLHVEIAKDMGIWFEGCDVHHIDGDNLNNLKSNLICLTKDKHKEAHKRMKKDFSSYIEWINKQKQTV